MPNLAFSRSIAAGATDTPLQSLAWQWEYAPGMCAVRTMLRTTAVGVTYRITVGASVIQESSPVQSGGTAGVTPSELNSTPVDFIAPAGARIKLEIVNTTAGALTVDGLVQLEQVG